MIINSNSLDDLCDTWWKQEEENQYVYPYKQFNAIEVEAPDNKTVSDYVKEHDYDHKSAEGLRVKVIEDNRYHQFAGKTGTIIAWDKGVKIDGIENSRSKYGCYWFEAHNLEVIEDNKNNENKTEDNKMALSGNYVVAVVKFENGYSNKEYNFALYPNVDGCCDVDVGDYVLVDNGSYDVVKVVEIKSKDEVKNLPTKEVICKLDFSNFNARKKAREDKRKLKTKMDKMLKESQELLLYQAIADKSPEMAQMLADYKALGDV